MNKYNLTDILSKKLVIEEQDSSKVYKFDGIQIPMIQRDYAQGRADEAGIRNRFLKSIFNALVKNENLELDFIYGSIKELDKKIHFIPLDGQQRLTTLFLLHWYIGNRELKDIELNNFLTSLKGFTYATRSSARDFCEKLVSLLIIIKGSPSIELANAAWFYNRFEKDPTVKAMLIMLDAIHLCYEEEIAKNPELKLISSISKLSFYLLPLGGFNLSDELYIKMNARGKQLTDFENFKADLINWIRNENILHNADFYKMVKFEKREMPYHLSFAIKLDNKWTHLFWEYVNQYLKIDSKNIDIYYLRFWNRFLLNNFIITSNESLDVIEKSITFKMLYGNEVNEDNYKYDGFEFYQKLLDKKNVVVASQTALDGLAENFYEIHKCLHPAWSVKDNWNLFDEKINQRQRILFLSISLYLQNNTFDLVKFKNWIRIVWNIIIDPDIRSISVMINIMRIIEKLSRGSGDIYKFLIGPNFPIIIEKETSFIKAQLEEERFKAELIESDPNWESELISAEKHPLFQGNIGFLLLDKPDIPRFKQRLIMANYLYSNKGTNDLINDNSLSIKHLLIRAVISNIRVWETLEGFNIGDNFENWQLLLRRKSNVQQFICNLCDFKDQNLVILELLLKVISKSNIDGWSQEKSSKEKAKYIHQQLFQDGDFHEWMQAKGAVNLKWSNNHIYIHRPRSWYDWVALETNRNEIATELIKQFCFTTTQKCGEANFYWGAKIELNLSKTNFCITAEFDDYGDLRIGVKDNSKSIIPQSASISPTDIEEKWLIRKIYTYTNVNSHNVSNLISKINTEVFNEMTIGSIFNIIL